MGDDPSVTVLMPVRDAASFLRKSLQSVFAQTYPDFEILVVDDASDDGTPEILARVADPRLRTLRLERRAGVATALNEGLSMARGRYVARMDADDIALPDRLARQVTAVERDPSVGILGANFQPVDAEGRLLGPPTSVPTSPGHIRWMLHVHNCVNHPTVVANRRVLVDLGGYRPDAEPAEDYDMWVRAMDVTHVANLPDVVLLYRVHEGSASIVGAADASRSADAVAAGTLTRLLGREPDPDALRILRDLERSRDASIGRLRRASRLLWTYTNAVLSDPTLTRRESTSIRRDAASWFGTLVLSAARSDPRAAGALVLSRRDGPPPWALVHGAAQAGGRLFRSVFART